MNNEQSTIVNNQNRYKVVFLGDSSVGKTSLVQHIIYGSFRQAHQPTICIESAKKIITHHNQIYKLMLWDTAGQEKFNSLIPSFVRGSDCAVIVYDVTNQQSLISCTKWIQMIRDVNSEQQTSIILVANKIDQQTKIKNGSGFELAIRNKASYIETSAKLGKGIQQLVAQIADTIQKHKFKSQKETKSSEGDLNSSRKLKSSTFSKVSVSKVPSEVKIKTSNSCCYV